MLIAVLLIAGGIGFGARALVSTPAEAQLPEEPPQVVTAEVTSQQLTTTFDGTGVVQAKDTSKVRAQVASKGRAVVSGRPLSRGDHVRWCEPLIEVSGRPVFALAGDVPSYRTLTRDSSGTDVRQLQSALQECGYAIAVDGEYGPATAAVVKQLYRDAGYEPVWEEKPISTGSTSDDETGTETEGNKTEREGSTHQGSATEGLPAESDATAAEPPTAQKAVKSATIPLGEIAFLPSGGTVTDIAALGSQLSDKPAVTLAHSGLSLHIELKAGVRTALDGTQRLSVTIKGEPTELEFPEVTVEGTANDSGGLIYPIDVPLPENTPADLLGSGLDYRITIGDETKYSTVVPVAALYSDPAGGSTIRVVTEPGTEPKTVPVTVVATGSGNVAIKAPGDAEFEAGDTVAIGAKS